MLTHRKLTAILLHDGLVWHAVVLHRTSSGWAVEGVRETPGRNANRLPEDLLEFVGAARARRLRVLCCSEVQSIQFQIPPDIEPEELQTAVRFEYEHEVGANAGGDAQRLAVVALEALDFGGESGTVLTSPHSENTLKHHAHAAERVGLRFDGAGSLELAVLAWVCGVRKNDMRLLVLEESSAFYVAPGIGELPFTVAKLAIGTQPDRDAERERERLERAARRLAAQNDVPVTVLSCSPVTEQLQERLAPLFANAESVEWHALADVVADIAKTAAATSHPGLPEGPCPLVGPSPPPRDPHRWGTWGFFAIILMTVLGSFLHWRDLSAEEQRLVSQKEAWEELQQERENAESQKQRLRERRDEEIARQRALAGTRILPAGFLGILDTLAAAMPAYTRIQHIAKDNDARGLELTGYTAWQEGLTRLNRALNNTLKTEGLMTQLEILERTENEGRELKFTLKVVQGEVSP
ncbi:MAG: hypothetical protein ACOCWJ_06155 [Verrucomicrobiota bacterium]